MMELDEERALPETSDNERTALLGRSSGAPVVAVFSDETDVLGVEPLTFRERASEFLAPAISFFDTKPGYNRLFALLVLFIDIIYFVLGGAVGRTALKKTVTVAEEQTFKGDDQAFVRFLRGGAEGQALMWQFASGFSILATSLYLGALLTSFIVQENYLYKARDSKSLFLAISYCCGKWKERPEGWRTSAYMISKALAFGDCVSISVINFILYSLIKSQAELLGLKRNSFSGGVDYTNSTKIDNGFCADYSDHIKAICALEQLGIDEKRTVEIVLCMLTISAFALFAIPTRTPRANSRGRVTAVDEEAGSVVLSSLPSRPEESVTPPPPGASTSVSPAARPGP